MRSTGILNSFPAHVDAVETFILYMAAHSGWYIKVCQHSRRLLYIAT